MALCCSLELREAGQVVVQDGRMCLGNATQQWHAGAAQTLHGRPFWQLRAASSESQDHC